MKFKDKLLFILVLVIILILFYFALQASKIPDEGKSGLETPFNTPVTILDNTLASISNPIYLEKIGEFEATITAYSSTIEQTDSTPFITASGKRVRKGIIANNYYKFGTKIEIDGEIYEVQDRMSKKYNKYYFDIWMSSKEEAIQFGKQTKQVIIYH